MLPFFLSVLACESDREFMLHVYEEYYPLMRSKAASIVRGTAIDDAIHDACIRLIGKISLLRALDRSKLAAYIVYTVRSAAIDALRKQNARERTNAGSIEDAEHVADPGKPIDEIVIRAQEIDALRRAVLRLSERERDVLHFRYTLDMKDEEIGQILGLASSSVRSLLFRTRKKVFEQMQKEGNGRD